MPILHNYIQKHSHIIHQIQFAQPHYVTHQTIRVRDSFSPCFWLPSNWIYAAEISSPGVKNMGGTMEWLSGLGGLPHMQFFHTLLPVWLLSPAWLIWPSWGIQECWLSSSIGERPQERWRG